ncbi:MAG: DNA polymerase I [Paludibacteraceae bacterium]|nr:DNA polymerase I [Paludibacteraceae bacterium]
MKNTVLLIDAYAMIYRAYYAFINAPRVNASGKNTSAIFGFVITLDELLRQVNPSYVAVAFDPKGGTFRHEAYEKYKAQRQETPEDIRFAIPYIKRILTAMNITQIEVAGFEADDVIGTLSRKLAGDSNTILMATPDKDYGQLVTHNVLMYRPRHKGGFETLGPSEVCEKYGLQRPEQVIDLLALMGDSSDNIPGCPGVGEKTAVKLLQQFDTVENLLEHTDDIKGALQQKVREHAEDIKFSKFLATIRTDVPVDTTCDDIVRRSADVKALSAIYQELGFRSLLKKLQSADSNAANTAAVMPANGQLDLFSQPDNKIQNPTAEVVGTSLFEHHNSSASPDIINIPQSIPQRVGIAIDGSSIAVAVDEKSAFLMDDVDALRTLLIANPDTVVVAHDLKPLLRILPPQCRKYDTLLAHYVLQPELQHDIESLASTLLGVEISSGLSDKQQLAAKATVSLALSYGFEAQIDSNNMHDLFWDIEMPLVPVLDKMERNGVRIDTAELRRSSDDLVKRMGQLEGDVQALAGTAFNVSSPKQVGEVLFDQMRLDPKAKKTKTGQYVTSEDVLEPLRHEHPIVDKILDYRAIKKLLSTYIDALPLLINAQTGKIHTSYNQAVTATGRLSSSNPNLQNIPVRTALGREIRRAFVPDDGCRFMSFDYSQIELRLMAHFSQDPHMLSAFRGGEDIHAATAAKIFKKPLAEVDSNMRRVAKTANFGIIYGISAFGLAQRLGVSRTEAKQLIDEYFASYPHIAQYIEDMKSTARRLGYVETMFHRRRYLPDINSHNATVRQFAERNAVNAPIQGTAADIIKMAMIQVDKMLSDTGSSAQMILQVHDELNFSAPFGEVEDLRQAVTGIMQDVVQLSVPLIVDCGIGDNWLEAH